MGFNGSPSEQFSKAIERARQIHGEQKRRGVDVPYLAHLLGVSALVLNDGGTEEQAIAAILHDTVEDHRDRIRFEDVASEFGPLVARIVEACTEPLEAVGSWRDIKQAYIDHMALAPLEAQRVILADKLDNARSVESSLKQWGSAYWDRFKSPTREDVGWYHQALHDRLIGWEKSPLHDEFNRLVAALAPQLRGG